MPLQETCAKWLLIWAKKVVWNVFNNLFEGIRVWKIQTYKKRTMQDDSKISGKNCLPFQTRIVSNVTAKEPFLRKIAKLNWFFDKPISFYIPFTKTVNFKVTVTLSPQKSKRWLGLSFQKADPVCESWFWKFRANFWTGKKALLQSRQKSHINFHNTQSIPTVETTFKGHQIASYYGPVIAAEGYHAFW